MKEVIDITGNEYGFLHVLKFHHIGKQGKSYWTCMCKRCGKIVVLRKDAFAYKYSQQVSCGCYHREESSKRMVKYHENKRGCNNG